MHFRYTRQRGKGARSHAFFYDRLWDVAGGGTFTGALPEVIDYLLTSCSRLKIAVLPIAILPHR